MYHKLNPVKLVLGCLLAITACSSPADNKQPQNRCIIIAPIKGPSAISMIKMIEDGSTRDSGYCYNFIIKDEPNQVKLMVMQQHVDIAVLPGTMAAILYNKGFDYQIMAVPVWGTLYLIGKEPITSWEQLKGRRIYMSSKGLTPDVVFRVLLKKHGIDPDKDILLDYSFPHPVELAQAVNANRASLALVSEPHVSIINMQHPSIRPIFDIQYEWSKLFGESVQLIQAAVVIKRSFNEQHPELVARFIKEYRQNIDWIMSHPDSAALLLVKHGLAPDYATAQKVIPRCNVRFVWADSIKNGIESYYAIFNKENPNLIGGKLPDENFYFGH